MAKRRAHLKGEGKCPDCGDRLLPGQAFCRVHQYKAATRSSRYRARRGGVT
jgi:uncharacterized OB-fold protein